MVIYEGYWSRTLSEYYYNKNMYILFKMPNFDFIVHSKYLNSKSITGKMQLS